MGNRCYIETPTRERILALTQEVGELCESLSGLAHRADVQHCLSELVASRRAEIERLQRIPAGEAIRMAEASGEPWGWARCSFCETPLLSPSREPLSAREQTHDMYCDSACAATRPAQCERGE